MMQNKQAGSAFTIVALLGITHMFNDSLQSIIQAVYPRLLDSLALSLTQIGIITLVFQLSSSIFQPLIGFRTDKKPRPYSLPAGMTFTMSGIFLLAFASNFPMVLIAVFLTGLGSSVFHPEASRLAYMASGGKHGLAQSMFQVGGNFGGSLGPLMAAFVITPYGQKNIAWFCILALLSIIIMIYISRWYKNKLPVMQANKKTENNVSVMKPVFPRKKIMYILLILLILIFSKYVYTASLTSYYMFYLMGKFNITEQSAQLYLFAFLFASAAGTFIGGPIGDKVGRKYVIWASILGTAPFALAMPYVDLFWTCVLSIFIGFILSSAFSAILVYAQELLPGKIGLVGGLFFGLAFGIAGVASAVLGYVADQTSLAFVYRICSFLPLIGLVAGLLPNMNAHKASMEDR